MTKSQDNKNIKDPKSQLYLYGFDQYFSFFSSLYREKKLPNTILLSGPGGAGKESFVYHFVNFLFSQEEEHKYNNHSFEINSKNSSHNLILNNVHPNFLCLNNDFINENINIDQVRELIKFLNKTSYSEKPKIVLINKPEHLNLNSSNALLKSLEEPKENTFFFIIHDHSMNLLDTIKSRCVEFKIHFTIFEKINIFNNIIKEYDFDYDPSILKKFFRFDTPGNLLKYLSVLNGSNLDLLNDNLSSIYFFIEKYRSKNDHNLLSLINLSIQNYYTDLSIKDSRNVVNYVNFNDHRLFDVYG